MDEDDDDVEMASRPASRSSNEPPIPHHLHSLGHMASRNSTSASPPIPPQSLLPGQGTYPIQGRGTPQPVSRPSSRNQRRDNSNMVPPNNYSVSQGPQSQNGFAYIPPPVYQPQAQSVMPMQQANMNQMPVYPYSQQQSQAPYITDRRQSMPPAFPTDRSAPSSENSPPSRSLDDTAPPTIEKRPPAKCRSIFTPIGPSESILAQHFGFGQEPQRSHSVDVGSVARAGLNAPVKSEDRQEKSPKPSPKSLPQPSPANGVPSTEIEPPPPSRNNSMTSNPGKSVARPKLKVQIPSEHSDAGDATAESSPRESAGTATGQSAKGPGEGNHPVVLPPPSPSVNLRSAGASGPVNPFARPPPASTAAPSETPISALPSRFCDTGLLPSPSSFYQDWALGFGSGRGGGNSDNMLPSPLNFQTPIGTSSLNLFKDDPEGSGKRKSPGPDQPDGSAPKRLKT